MIETEYLQSMIEDEIARLPLPTNLPGLYDPISYTMQCGGKRLRPLLLLASCQACGVKADEALSQAVGLEMFHNFTLLHDDVMDRAETRRGRPTVHVKWSDTTAILSGDTMLTLATQLVAKAPAEKLADVLDLFNRTAIQIYEGQQMDMDFEQRTDVTVDEYMEMIRLKTSVLLGCACAMGALMAHASEATRNAMYDFAMNLGLAFQLQDDYLDTFGDSATFGKTVGGDILNDKKTWLLITAMAEAPEEVAPWLGADVERSQRKVDAIKAVYEKLNLPGRIHELIDNYAAAAIAALDAATISAADREWFAALTLKLSTRKN
jgi:geranylgeranyl diphosphate synthase type II